MTTTTLTILLIVSLLSVGGFIFYKLMKTEAPTRPSINLDFDSRKEQEDAMRF